MVPGWFFIDPGRFSWFLRFQLGFSWFHVVFFSFFQGSRLVFHRSRWVLRVIDGSRLVFIVQCLFFWFQVGFLFFKVLGLFFMFFYCFRSGFQDSLMVPGWFRSETLRTPLICMLAPQSRFGLVMMMIDDGNGGQGLSHQFSFVHKQRISHRPTSTDGEINLG